MNKNEVKARESIDEMKAVGQAAQHSNHENDKEIGIEYKSKKKSGRKSKTGACVGHKTDSCCCCL